MENFIGKQIKRMRQKKGWSITKLAERSGVSKGYVSSIENHKTNPSAQMIMKVARALEVPVEKLVNNNEYTLDHGWVELIVQAKEIGIDREEIREFLAYESWKIKTRGMTDDSV
ncbi:Transcriptional regulator, contains XRE-family HTH domain [Fictibacillus solisalsi]|uniref:Transcriptional regulator, contains XRE-family HTH domain n=1 Tax=Fictibacillus solisalsi TaxID=459525 RepID=A0A1G9XEM8_9BACL|nr:helix-turn-helix domain-containing protein [Fictibacillus solisalsi]SDM94725.1 Transcriptional regulator, contains XRE-family HTH domain [Fictibacillus solisalsi]